MATKHFVKESLKAPATADFGSILGDYQNPKSVCLAHGNKTWRCAGWVDSQNSFGAMLRTRFVAVVQSKGDDNWKLELLTTE
jgi:hypothetical protein